METAGAGEEDSSDEETRDNLMEVDPDQDRKYLALFLSVFWISIYFICSQKRTSNTSKREIFFCGSFCSPGFRIRIRIRIH
jgi:hypothetical protein